MATIMGGNPWTASDGKLMSEQMGSYEEAFAEFSSELSTLFDLNEHLPKSLQDEVLKEAKELDEGLAATGGPDAQSQAANLLNELLDLNPNWRSQPLKYGPAWAKASKEVQRVVGKSVQSMQIYSRFDGFIRNMSLVYLVSQFENYLQRVLITSYQKHPEAVGLDKSVTLGQLLASQDIEAGKNLIIEREAADVLRKDPDELAQYIAGKWGIQISDIAHWNEFKERFYRRHCVVHNDGDADDNYRRKTGNTAISGHLTVDQTYLTDSIALFSDMAKSINGGFSEKFKSLKMQSGPVGFTDNQPNVK
jgi:hypothetical protein